MSSPTPAQRATAAHRLEFAMRELELWLEREANAEKVPQVLDLREQVDNVREVLTR